MTMLPVAMMLLLALLLGGCADAVTQGSVDESSEPGVVAAPPEGSFSPLSSLNPSTVEPGDRTTEIQITAADQELSSGTYFRVERWDGETWQLQHYVRQGEVYPADVEGFNNDAYGIEPGETLIEELPLDGLQVGIYRVGLEMRAIGGGPNDESEIQVYARLDVQPRQPGPVQSSELDGTEWRSAVVKGLDLPEDQQIALTFADGGVGAEVACNSFGAPFELTDGRLVVDGEDLMSTLMGCPEPRSTWDIWVQDLLLADPTVSLDDQRLTLSAGDDTVIFDRHIEPAPTPTDPNAPLSSWVPPPNYRYTIDGSCGPAARFFGEQEVTVRDGVPSSEVAHLPVLIADAEAVRAGPHDVVRIEHDPETGQRRRHRQAACPGPLQRPPSGVSWVIAEALDRVTGDAAALAAEANAFDVTRRPVAAEDLAGLPQVPAFPLKSL
ncbi:hypothetical protein BH23ACT9_BH23ACT9_05410 [soil metagenome]